MGRQHQKKLKTGFTTGTAAAAAAKGALTLILEGHTPINVDVKLLNGDMLSIPVHFCKSIRKNAAVCTVIKDAGDDPDITHKAEIGATVTLLETPEKEHVIIKGGKGVGVVTKPGLEIPPGEPAINPGPRRMIAQAVEDVLGDSLQITSVQVEIFVPQGDILAQKTLNARLGIIGGISILGTTGIVHPMSHEAYIATIESAMSVAHALGLTKLVLTTGRRSERFAQMYWDALEEESFIQIGDFFKASLELASKIGCEDLILAVFFGKAVKMAQGVPHTHAAKSHLTLHRLSEWTEEITSDSTLAREILAANTARHAFELICDHHVEIIAYVGRQMVKSARSFCDPRINVQGIIFDYEGNIIFNSLETKIK